MIGRNDFDLLVPGKGQKGQSQGQGGGSLPKNVLPWPPQSQDDESGGGEGGEGEGEEKEGGKSQGSGASGKQQKPQKGEGNYSAGKAEDVKQGENSAGALGVAGAITPELGRKIQEALGVSPNKLSRDAVEKIAQQAAAQLPEGKKGQHGSEAGLLKRRIAELYAPQVDWKQAMKTFVGRALSPDKVVRLRDRRHPGLFTSQGQKKHDALEKVVCAVDTSGSMGDSELAIILTEIKAIVEQKNVKEIDIIYFDTKIAPLIRLKGKGAVKKYDGKGAIGGGGTEFKPPLEEMNRLYKTESFGAAVFLTDGDADLDLPKPQYADKFIWVIIDNPTFKAPWGLKVIHITKQHLKDISDSI